MRFLLTAVLVFALAGVASATNPRLTNHTPQLHKGQSGPSEYTMRQGGDNFSNPTVIPGLPYTDYGTTCGYAHDATLSCGYAYTDPDVVYSLVAPGSSITVSLCGSTYDTEVAVFNSSLSEIACNDDFCGLQSEVDNVATSAGATYYIVVGGFSSACGDYTINVTAGAGPCVVTCPPGALQEGEPNCYDGYYDSYNGGCNSTGWTDICPQSGSSAVMCGTSGTYIYNGLSYRDTDWFQCYGAGGVVTETCTASFPLQLILIYGANCANLQYTYTTAAACQPATLSWNIPAQGSFWAWVGASQFNGVPCGSNYVLQMDGIWCPGSATENTTWGNVKSIYR